MKKKEPNYTAEQTENIIKTYQADPSRETVELLAKTYEKPVKSIIGKLSREGVYRREGYRGKTGLKPITKIELQTLIEDEVGVDLEGLEKAPKAVLMKLCRFLGIPVEEELS